LNKNGRNEKRILIEVAAFTPNAAIAACEAGANRIELCSGYAEGGLSPSIATIAWVKENVPLPVHVMVRPRIGDFVYNPAEKQIMLRDIAYCRQQGVEGIVAGALLANAEIDECFTKELVQAAHPMQVTFHRAFDLCPNPDKALNVLLKCRVHRVLTSGGEKSCVEGLQTIKRLLEKAAGKIIIMPGGGINPGNIYEILALDGISEIHLSGKRLVQSKMNQNSGISLTSSGEVNDYHWYECDPEIIKQVKQGLRVRDKNQKP